MADPIDYTKDPAIEQYVQQRLAAALGDARQLQHQAEEAQQQAKASMTASLEGEQLRQSVKAYVDALCARLPADRAALVPRSLPAHQLLEWVAANQQTLFAAPAVNVGVHGSGGRQPPNTDEYRKQQHDREIKAKGRAWLFGTPELRGGRR